MKTLKQIIKETVAEPKSPDEKRFKELHTKNVDVKDYPAKGDKATKDSKKMPRLADYVDDEEKLVYDTSYATEEVETLDEAFKAGAIKLKDGSNATLSKDDANVVNELFKELNPSNKKKMEAKMMESKSGFEEIVKFAKEAI